MSGRPVDKIVADLLDAVGAASELVGRGRDVYDSDRLLRLAGEAVIGRIGDSAAKLRDQHGDDLPQEVPWDDVVANRIIVDHVYHRVGYDLLWNTLERLMREERRNLPPLPTIVVDSRRVEHHPPCERRGRWPVRLLSPTSRVGSRLSNIKEEQ